MGQKLRWTAEAVSWLEKIYHHVTIDKPEAAKKIVNEIYRRVEILNQFPQSGYLLPNHSDLEIRVLLYGHYRIAYWIKSDRSIDILGVFHGAMDIQKYLAILSHT